MQTTYRVYLADNMIHSPKQQKIITIIAEHGNVTLVPPQAGWAMGRRLAEVLNRYERQGCGIERV